MLCPGCAAGLEPWTALGGVRTAVAYRGTGAQLVRRFKFDDRRDALDVLAAALAARLDDLPGAMRVVAVPRHRARVRETGSDPAFDLARALARRLQRRFEPRALRRTRPTAQQTGLGSVARRRNVAGAFRADPTRVADVPVLLVDDVVTTGATLAAARRALRHAGATPIHCTALAATPPP